MRRDPQNWKHLLGFAGIAIAVLIAGVAFRPASLKQQPKQQQEVSISQSEVAKLQRIASETALSALNDQYSAAIAVAAPAVVNLGSSGFFWDAKTLISAPTRPADDKAVHADGARDPVTAALHSSSYPFFIFESQAPGPVLAAAPAPPVGASILAVTRSRDGAMTYAPGSFVRMGSAICEGDQWNVVDSTLILSEEAVGAAVVDLNGALLGIVLPCGERFAVLSRAGITDFLRQQSTPEGYLRGAFGLQVAVTDTALRVTDVWDDTPAARAGLIPGDRLEQVSGIPTHTAAELVAALHAATPATLTVQRDRRTLRVTLDPAPLASDAGFSLVHDGGLPLASVAKTSSLYVAGVRPGDTITRIDGAAATKLAAKRLEDGKPHTLVVSMGARSKEVAVNP